MKTRAAGRTRAQSPAPAPDGRAARRVFLIREAMILLGFLVLVGTAVVTVVLPEFSREPEGAEAGGSSTQATGPAGTPGIPTDTSATTPTP